jgi:sigma-54 dependent transcriptional regulator, acetoin dehydrogenase operon transcriptional activator AcoR
VDIDIFRGYADDFGLDRLRPEIAMSWYRSLMCGLRPDASTEPLALSDIDHGSRLARAAKPVVDALAEDLRGSPFCLLLADRNACIVDRWFSDTTVERAVDGIGALVGSTFTEETSGTNSIATAYELRRGIAVNGSEHFIEALRKFSCYGKPIVHPVTRRVEAVLEITGPQRTANPLWAPIINRAAQDIEQRLLDGARRTEQRMLAAYEQVCQRRGHQPVVVLGESLVLANPRAVEQLSAIDYVLLRDLLDDRPGDDPYEQGVHLSSGRFGQVRFQRIPAAIGSALFSIALDDTRPVLVSRRKRQDGAGAEMGRYRLARTPVLITGEPGSGRSAATRALAGDVAMSTIEATLLAELGQTEWISRLAALRRRPNELTVIDDIDMLPAAAAKRVADLLRSSPGWFALTSAPVSGLGPDQAVLVSQCMARIELQPLRFRRDEIPELVKAFARRFAGRQGIRFDGQVWRVLRNHSWPGNLRELASVVAYAVEHRRGETVSVNDLPEPYRDAPVSRQLTQLEQAEHDTIVRVLRSCGGNKVHAAAELGIGRTTLYKRLRQLGIEG